MIKPFELVKYLREQGLTLQEVSQLLSDTHGLLTGSKTSFLKLISAIDTQAKSTLDLTKDSNPPDQSMKTAKLNDWPLLNRQRYERRGHIGKGAMGEVWRLYDRSLKRHVAYKLIQVNWGKSVRMLHRFIDEARIGARLSHPGLSLIHI